MVRKAELPETPAYALLAIKGEIAQITADTCAPASRRLCDCGSRVISAHYSAGAWCKGHKHWSGAFSGEGSSAPPA